MSNCHVNLEVHEFEPMTTERLILLQGQWEVKKLMGVRIMDDPFIKRAEDILYNETCSKCGFKRERTY